MAEQSTKDAAERHWAARLLRSTEDLEARFVGAAARAPNSDAILRGLADLRTIRRRLAKALGLQTADRMTRPNQGGHAVLEALFDDARRPPTETEKVLARGDRAEINRHFAALSRKYSDDVVKEEPLPAVLAKKARTDSVPRRRAAHRVSKR